MNFLYTKVAAAVASQGSVEESLKHIEEQQNALGRTLDSYEQQTKAILNTQGRSLDLGPANRERDNRFVIVVVLLFFDRLHLVFVFLDSLLYRFSFFLFVFHLEFRIGFHFCGKLVHSYRHLGTGFQVFFGSEIATRAISLLYAFLPLLLRCHLIPEM